MCTSVLAGAKGTTQGVGGGVDAGERFCAARNQPAVAPDVLRPRLCLMGSSRRGCAKVSRKPFGDRRFWTGGRVAAVVGLVFGASIPHRIAGPLNPDAEEHAQEPPGSHGTRAALTLAVHGMVARNYCILIDTVDRALYQLYMYIPMGIKVL